jgi:Tol biopolymer transport system component
VVGVDGSGLARILADPPGHTTAYLAWSPGATPDGSEKIAFNVPLDGQVGNEVWVVNPDGTGLQNLTGTDLRTEVQPTWAPDAARLAVQFIDLAVSGGALVPTAAGLEIYDLAADGAGGIAIQAVETVFADVEHPEAVVFGDLDWARTGDVLAFSRTPAGGDLRDLWTIDLLDPAHPVQVTSTPTLDESHPSWSPDDGRLVFVQRGFKKEAKRTGLHTIRIDGTGLVNLGAPAGAGPEWAR